MKKILYLLCLCLLSSMDVSASIDDVNRIQAYIPYTSTYIYHSDYYSGHHVSYSFNESTGTITYDHDIDKTCGGPGEFEFKYDSSIDALVWSEDYSTLPFNPEGDGIDCTFNRAVNNFGVIEVIIDAYLLSKGYDSIIFDINSDVISNDAISKLAEYNVILTRERVSNPNSKYDKIYYSSLTINFSDTLDEEEDEEVKEEDVEEEKDIINKEEISEDDKDNNTIINTIIIISISVIMFIAGFLTAKKIKKS
ncbi:MAG: hypothetical protein R3Y13_01015 [bacterium]